MVFALNITGQDQPTPYFNAYQMPDMLRWYPSPPKEGSVEYIRDVKLYYHSKSQRLDPERAAIAVRDAHYGLTTIITEFSVPFGLQISWQNTPEIFKLLRDALATTDSICKLVKAKYMRPRPFVVFNETTLIPKDEADLRRSGSFPSGHCILGWSAALLLMEINPEAADTLLARGYEFGQSRVVSGCHWQSDVDAGRHAASVAYAKLHTSDRFLHQMEAAKKEFVRLKCKYAPIGQSLSNDSAYNEFKKELTLLEKMERTLDCTIQRYPFGFDETTGMKMVYIMTNESPYNVSNGVDNIILSKDNGDLTFVVNAVIRHDRGNTDDILYGLYVVGKNTEGEIEISRSTYLNLEAFLFQSGEPEFLNLSTIRNRVTNIDHLIPFSSTISEENKVRHHRFFESSHE